VSSLGQQFDTRSPDLSTPPDPVVRYTLDDSERQAVRALAESLVRKHAVPPTGEYLQHAVVECHQLPAPVRDALVRFKLLDSPSGGLVLSGLPVLEADLGPTPDDTDTDPDRDELRYTDAMLLLLASVLGDPISHAAVQDGRLILNVCPMRGDEDTQLASSSTGGLEWHNEDAYHDHRADWLLLLCLRNPQRVPTTFARVEDLEMAPAMVDTLFEERFILAADSSHALAKGTGQRRRIAVFSGDRRAPFVRIDPAFMERDLGDRVAEHALTSVIDQFEQHLRDVVLQPGDVFVVDNLRAVHGRRPFEAHYNGADRWLRLARVAADLRRSAGRRTGSHGRAIA
jgi:Fe(II)/alpha-ketoglutarate-dependent arginine beta-hydroxylase